MFLKAPELETNALANDYGQSDTKNYKCDSAAGMPQLHVHTYDFGAGNNILKLERV